jgi:hypothetical protein
VKTYEGDLKLKETLSSSTFSPRGEGKNFAEILNLTIFG